MGISELSATVTKTAVSVLTLVAALVVVLGIVNAVRSRRRRQVVIVDIGQLEGIHAPGLSPWLRQRVRNALHAQRQDAAYVVRTVLGRDVAQGRLPVRVTLQSAQEAISGAAEDALATLSQGVRAIAPKQAEDLLGALSATLPRQRGYLVRVVPMVRGADDRPRMGLSVEVAQLDGPPIATTTFWEPVSTGEPGPVQERLIELIEPTAYWIAMHLMALRLSIRPMSTFQRRPSEGVQRGMRTMVAGALGRLAMNNFPSYATAFGEDAVRDLRLAADELERYHRPWEMLAGVREQMGEAPRALRAWKQAETLLTGHPDEQERLRVRRLKCQLLIGDPRNRAEVIADLATTPLSENASMRTLYNRACLYATLGDEYMELAREAIGCAVLSSPQENVRALALKDTELAPITGLAEFLDRLIELRPLSPTVGDEAKRLVEQARMAFKVNGS